MTTSIPTPFSSSASGPDSSQSVPSLDNLISALGNSPQGGSSASGPSADFRTLLDSSSGQQTAPAPSQANSASQQATPAPAPSDEAAAAGASGVEAGKSTKDTSSDTQDTKASPPSASGSTRDIAEAAAAMFLPLWVQHLPPQPTNPGLAGNAVGGASGGSTLAQSSGTVASPAATDAGTALPLTSAADGNSALSGMYAQIAAAMSTGAGQMQQAAATGASPTGIKGLKAAPRVDASAMQGSTPAATEEPATMMVSGLERYAEKFAGNPGGGGSGGSQAQTTPQKNFLMPVGSTVKTSNQGDGIGTAKAGSNMPASSTASVPTAVDPGVTSTAMAPFGGMTVTQGATPAAPALITPTLAPVLALRAVETVLNVVDSRQVSNGPAGSVKLDFNFRRRSLGRSCADEGWGSPHGISHKLPRPSFRAFKRVDCGLGSARRPRSQARRAQCSRQAKAARAPLTEA